MPLPPPPLDPKDAEHVRLLVLLHYVLAGLAMLGIGFLVLHFQIMDTLFSRPDFPNSAPAAAQSILNVLKVVYLFGGLMLMAAAVINVLSAGFLRQRRHRMFSLVVAGINCIQIPFGTALGVFTFLVLGRDSVRQSYEG